MAPPTRMTPEKIELCRKLFRSFKMNREEIAHLFGVSFGTIYRYTHEIDLDKTALPEQLRNTINFMYHKKGLGVNLIARALSLKIKIVEANIIGEMRRHIILTDTKRTQIIRALEDGLSVFDVAQKFDVKQSFLCNHFSEHIKGRKSPRILSDEEKYQIKEMFSLGIPPEEIARKFKIALSTCYKYNPLKTN